MHAHQRLNGYIWPWSPSIFLFHQRQATPFASRVDDETPSAHTFMPDTCLTPVVSNTAKRERTKLKLCGGAWSRLWCALGWLLPSKAFKSRKCVVLAFRVRRTTHSFIHSFTHLRNFRWEKLGRTLSVLSRNFPELAAHKPRRSSPDEYSRTRGVLNVLELF